MTIRWAYVRTAAVLNAVVALATLVVAVGLIGVGVLFDRDRFLRLAVESPGPILLMDALKPISALAFALLVAGFHGRLRPASPRRIKAATAFGGLAVSALLANALLSVYAVLNAGQLNATAGARFNIAITVLALTVGVASGVWYLLISLTALRGGVLPRWLCRLGLAIGAASLVPPLGLVALVLTPAWSAGIAATFPAEPRHLV